MGGVCMHVRVFAFMLSLGFAIHALTWIRNSCQPTSQDFFAAVPEIERSVLQGKGVE